ncbi:MAG: glycosyltransferase family 4 protein [Chlamydiota bacterium]
MASPLARDSTSGMLDTAISVTLFQAAASYQATLAIKLAQAGMLRRVFRFGPELQILEANVTGHLKLVKQFPFYRVLNRYLWAAWGLLPGRCGPQLPMVATSWLAARIAARWLPREGIFHGLPGLALPSLQARVGNSKSLLENATLHPRQWQREVLYECAQAGVRASDCAALLPAALIRRLEREYELCDAIIVPSTTARRSFEEFGLAKKALLVWPGVDEQFFSPASSHAPSPVFRACFVGRIELSKGIAYLLKAWKALGLPQGELVLAGPVQPEMKSMLKEGAACNVRVTGTLSPREVVDLYRTASVFVHPSSNEGLGLVLLEAMACGLPVIATNRSGAEDCVSNGKDGIVIPARRVDALAEAILWCWRHQQDLPAMGAAARRKIEQRFARAHYEERQIALYRSLAGQQPLPGTVPQPSLFPDAGSANSRRGNFSGGISQSMR